MLLIIGGVIVAIDYFKSARAAGRNIAWMYVGVGVFYLVSSLFALLSRTIILPLPIIREWIGNNEFLLLCFAMVPILLGYLASSFVRKVYLIDKLIPIEKSPPIATEINCPTCGAFLRRQQVETMVGNPQYNDWCREGYCSQKCFEAKDQ